MLLMAFALAAATASGDAAADASPRPKDERTCIVRRQINALSPLEGRYALARLSAGRFYLLTLGKSCRELSPAFTRNLVLERGPSRICDDGTALVSFEEVGVGPTRCRIEKIDQVASKAEALDLIESRAETEENR